MNKQLNISFYQHLGKLFYAIAAIDNTIENKEIDKLKQLIKKDWLTVDESEDDFFTDAAYQIEIVFDWLVNNNEKAQTCYNEFMLYFKEHKYFFSEAITKLILKTVNEIAASFAGKNKTELVLLGNLSLALRNNENN